MNNENSFYKFNYKGEPLSKGRLLHGTLDEANEFCDLYKKTTGTCLWFEADAREGVHGNPPSLVEMMAYLLDKIEEVG